MTISAKIIADSISPQGIRLTTVQCRYPRFIHAELMTHRMFSRNASSSRAIPVERLIQDVIDDPAMPVKWFKNKPGMQGTVEIVGAERDLLVKGWLTARDCAVDIARAMVIQKAHKQHINRVLEPFAHINVLITATEWANFFALRDHPDAQPEIRVLAQEIKKAMAERTPKLLQPGQWHVPYVTEDDHALFEETKDILVNGMRASADEKTDILRRLSVARCASVSYKTVEGEPMTFERAFSLHDKLLSAQPLHASPAEHQATPDLAVPRHQFAGRRSAEFDWQAPELHGNLRGWVQYRKTLPNENIAA